MSGGGWEDWTWDPSLFEGAAPFYVVGRLPYAAGLAEALHEALGLDGRGRLLDVGCGPGVVALLVAHLFEEVVGVDPDPGMLAEAERQAAVVGVGNARWERLRAEELPGGLGSFRAITFAASFHWMDRPLVAGLVREMLDPGGAVVQVDQRNHPPAQEVVDEVRVRFLGAGRRAGQGVRNTSPDGEDAVFRAAGFAPAIEVPVPDGRVLHRSVDQVVALALSSSATAPHLFGDRVDAFVAELRAALSEKAAGATFPVRLEDNLLRIWRRA